MRCALGASTNLQFLFYYSKMWINKNRRKWQSNNSKSQVLFVSLKHLDFFGFCFLPPFRCATCTYLCTSALAEFFSGSHIYRVRLALFCAFMINLIADALDRLKCLGVCVCGVPAFSRHLIIRFCIWTYLYCMFVHICLCVDISFDINLHIAGLVKWRQIKSESSWKTT